ncbi:MAG: type II toxin-antitoxin system HicA family toxin [Dehalococcoidia bacterium]|nr:type II toxin-antitoxin system HicA family toxin [Dehalococcoidia bacterium]
MPRLHTANPGEVIRVLERLGFSKVRQTGSHGFFRHPDGRTTVVPIHQGRDLGRGLFRKILDDAGITAEEFERIR